MMIFNHDRHLQVEHHSQAGSRDVRVSPATHTDRSKFTPEVTPLTLAFTMGLLAFSHSARREGFLASVGDELLVPAYRFCVRVELVIFNK
jgi:hypothetical protein